MKADIHPKYHTITFTCACGSSFIAGSTIEGDFHTEICSNCHPFYTGKQKLIDSSGRVDKFLAKMKKAQEKAEKKVKTVQPEEAEEAAKESTVTKITTKVGATKKPSAKVAKTSTKKSTKTAAKKAAAKKSSKKVR